MFLWIKAKWNVTLVPWVVWYRIDWQRIDWLSPSPPPKKSTHFQSRCLFSPGCPYQHHLFDHHCHSYHRHHHHHQHHHHHLKWRWRGWWWMNEKKSYDHFPKTANWPNVVVKNNIDNRMFIPYYCSQTIWSQLFRMWVALSTLWTTWVWQIYPDILRK